MTTTVRAADFVGSLGVNTHIDFGAYGYENLSIVESAINYLGLKNIHDSAQTAADAQTWLQVSQATGAKFDDYIAETSPAAMTTDLGVVQQLASEGVLNFVEGGNEEDDAYPASLGNTLQIAAQFQQQVYATGHALGLPVIDMGFGAGWTAANNWQDDYGTVGDLSAYTDFGNAHVYPNVAQGTDWAIQRMNGLAQLAAASRPVITTEIGWDLNAGFTPTDVAKNVLNATMDGMKDGNPLTYFYGLFNDGAGAFGLMNQDGTPPPPTTVTIAATDANPVVNDSSVTITATSGNHMLFIGGTHDTAVLTGGTETVQAYQGYNTITTGSGNDTLRFGGSGNRIDAGAGHNTLYESGSANTLVMPGAGQGLDDIYGYVLQNGDLLDFTAALKGTAWDEKVSDVGSYLHVGMSGNDAIISISNNAGGAASKAADLHGSGAVDLKTLLAHSTI